MSQIVTAKADVLGHLFCGVSLNIIYFPLYLDVNLFMEWLPFLTRSQGNLVFVTYGLGVDNKNGVPYNMVHNYALFCTRLDLHKTVVKCYLRDLCLSQSAYMKFAVVSTTFK